MRAALELLPEGSADRSWAAELIESTEAFGPDVVSVVAVRGAGNAADVEAQNKRLADLREVVGDAGNVVSGRQGDGFTFAVERGARVEFSTG